MTLRDQSLYSKFYCLDVPAVWPDHYFKIAGFANIIQVVIIIFQILCRKVEETSLLSPAFRDILRKAFSSFTGRVEVL